MASRLRMVMEWGNRAVRGIEVCEAGFILKCCDWHGDHPIKPSGRLRRLQLALRCRFCIGR